jgi:hypothetical protein
VANYISAPAKVTECYECGNVELCEVLIADSPEAETGYVDEYALCEACKNGTPRLSVPDIFGNDWHG